MKIRYLLPLLLLAACCSENNQNDCTKDEIAHHSEDRVPEFVSEKDGVKLYVVKPCWSCYAVYFTTPCGDTQWTEDHPYGKGQHDYVQKHVNGSGCKEQPR